MKHFCAECNLYNARVFNPDCGTTGECTWWENNFHPPVDGHPEWMYADEGENCPCFKPKEEGE
jgi:hypothetical protein